MYHLQVEKILHWFKTSTRKFSFLTKMDHRFYNNDSITYIGVKLIPIMKHFTFNTLKHRPPILPFSRYCFCFAILLFN